MKKTTYYQKLQHPNWQRKRLEIMQRDNFTCALCNDKETQLHVHHVTYEKNTDPWDYSIWNLVTICRNCHDTLHSSSEEEKVMISMNLWFYLFVKRGY